MFSAVSNLSPVNIHTLISNKINIMGLLILLALIRSFIVSGTSSCKRSSTAVAPSKKKSFSKMVATCAR